MIYPEQRLREELKRMTDQVQPGQLRPLRAPGPGRRPRRLLVPAGAVLAGGAIVAAAALLASTAPGLGPAATPTGAAADPGLPPYYVVATQAAPSAPVQVVVHDSVNGRVTGVIAVQDPTGRASLAGSGDGRHFVIETAEGSSVRLYRLSLSPDGRPALQLAATYSQRSILGGGQLALSPDGTETAIAQSGLTPCPGGIRGTGCDDFQIQVVNLATRKTRIWNEYFPMSAFPSYGPGELTWAGDTALVFTVTRAKAPDGAGPASVTVRTLDTAAAGNDVVTSAPIPLPATLGPETRLTAADGGREIIGTSCADSRSGTALHGTGVARVVELSAADGWAIHEYRTQSTYFRWPAREQVAFESSCAVESVDPTGQNALVLAFGLGRFHDGAYTALPGFQLDLTSSDPEAEAAW